MVLLKVDPRITERIKEGVEKRHRSMFVIIGDKSRDQIVNLHHLLTKAMVAKSRPSVLWCYKNKLDISSHWKKRGKEVKRRMKHGLLTADMVDPFSLFAESGGITHCMYKDSERVLGNTFGMCILQDVHERFRTESHSETTGRFNERFLLSVASCKACLIMDDELNVIFHGKETGDQLNGLSILSHNRMSETGIVRKEFEELSEMRQNMKNLKEQLNYDFPVGPLIRKCCTLNQDSEGLLEMQQDLKNLKEQHKDDFPVGPLIRNCCTLDQGNAIKIFLVAILGKAVRNTVALLAARGRGKSAALGLSIAGAVAAGYSNIFVTAPHPENLKTLFEFVVKGPDVLGYKALLDKTNCVFCGSIWTMML